MTIEELGRMADEYAKEIAPDNKEAQTAISADSLGFLNKVMEKYCLVEKEAVTKCYNHAVNRLNEMKVLGSTVDDRIYNEGELNGKIDLLESLFPDLGKEVEG